MQQVDALNLLKMGKNIFLTGAAGSGKTFLLNQYIKYLKDNKIEVAVTASTGIAATHLHGVTIHSWSGIGIRDSFTKKDLDKLADSSRIQYNFKKCKVLIIDEISMLHKHQLDMVDEVTRYILESDEPFGGLQVILCGDFFQLPPVTSGAASDEKQFAFEAAAWRDADFQVCYLQEQHRQGEDPLLDVLNDIRNGVAGEQTKIPLRTRYKKEPSAVVKATKLYTRNINVDAINEAELAKTPGDAKLFTMLTRGYKTLVEGLKKNCLAPEQLRLKVGAEVMFIKNDTLGAYMNGTRGVVTGFDKSENGWPIIQSYDNETIVAFPEDWKFEEDGVVRATISQVPLRLAWAITIHKSQGMTLDAAEIDLGDAFEPGMGYVALSRVRSLNGLKLMNLNEMALKVNSKVLLHDQVFRENSTLNVDAIKRLTSKKLTKQFEKTLLRFGAKIKKTPRVARVVEAVTN
jgi:ATP-dependent DNA helicase PIF1